MLQKLRDHAGSWFIKLLFVILVLSFSLWGIGDVLRNYSHTRPLLSVGSFTVTLEEFARMLKQAHNNAQDSSSKPLTPEQIKQLNLPNKVLEQFTLQGLTRQEIKAHKLVVSDETLRVTLQSMPHFHDEKHTFNPDYFRRVLQHNHTTEAHFINNLRMSLLQSHLLQPFMQTQHLPQSYVQLLSRGLNQDYIFKLVTIPFNKLPLPAAPNDTVLKAFYDQNRDRFLRPETRSVSLLILDLDHIRKNVQLSEERLQKEYEQRINDFTIPERRSIEEVIIPNEHADEAVDMLQKGASLSTVAKQFKGDHRNIITISRDELPQDTADAVFTNQQVPFMTTPLKTSLGTQVIRVSRIEPKRVRPLEEIRAELITDLREKIASEQYKDLLTKVEDNLAGGAALREVAQENNLLLITLNSLEIQGSITEGNFPASWSADARKKVTELSFATPEGADTPLTEISNNSVFIVHVDKIVPAHIPDFLNCRDQVTSAWQKDKRYEATVNLASQLSKALSVREFEQQAMQAGLKTQNFGPVSRARVERDKTLKRRFTRELWQNMFNLRQGKAVYSPYKENIVVAMLTEIKPYTPKPSQKHYKALEKLLQKMVSKDIEASFLKGLRTLYPVEVNASMLATVTSNETQ